MSEERPWHDGLDIPDDELIQGIIKDAYAATPPEEVAACQLHNMFTPVEVAQACENSDIPPTWVGAVATRLQQYIDEEQEVE